MEPRLSPDGRRLVFGSERSGALEEIWVAEADGSNPQQLTHGPGRAQGSPSWSPDGRRIVFDSFADDTHFHIWMIDADGGPPRRLTTQAGDERVPTWSRDGRWIYFSSEQGAAARDLWRVSADGKTSERLIRGASGPFACESNDGKNLLFQPRDADSPLMAMPLTGGGARQLVACVRRQRPLAPVLRACITSPAIPARIRHSMCSIWRPAETGSSARSRDSSIARWVWRCRPTGRPSCIREQCIRMPTSC